MQLKVKIMAMRKKEFMVADEKKALRKEILRQRRDLEPELFNQYNDFIFEKVVSLKEYKESRTIFIYVSYNHEVDTIRIINDALFRGKAVAVPRVSGRNMDFFYIDSMQDLEKGNYKILEPKAYCQRAKYETGVPIFMPGLAFGRDGNRCGYGGGYYDRYLKKIWQSRNQCLNNNCNCSQNIIQYKILCIALAFEFQVRENVPSEVFDIKVDKIITDRAVNDLCRSV